jgi:hypothetical protein
MAMTLRQLRLKNSKPSETASSPQAQSLDHSRRERVLGAPANGATEIPSAGPVMLFSCGRYLGDRYFDQRIRKRRCPSEIRVDAGAESVHRAFPSARVSPISRGGGATTILLPGQLIPLPSSGSIPELACRPGGIMVLY